MESATDNMPSVTMNGGIFVRDTKIPLMSPATVAAARAPIVPPTMPKSERKKTIAEIDMATREPTARSNSSADDDQGLAEGHEAKGGGAGDDQKSDSWV